MANGFLTIMILFVLLPLFVGVAWLTGWSIRSEVLKRGSYSGSLRGWSVVLVFAIPFVVLVVPWYSYQSAIRNEQALESAARDGNLVEVARLIDRGISVNAGGSGRAPIQEAIIWEQWPTVRYLILRGARNQQMKCDGHLVQDAAADLEEKGQFKLARLLRANGKAEVDEEY